MDDIYRFVCLVFRGKKVFTKQIRNFHEFFNQSDTFDAKNSYREICQNLGGQLPTLPTHHLIMSLNDWEKDVFAKIKLCRVKVLKERMRSVIRGQ